MSSYLITGVSRGLGFTFLEKVSSDPSNTVIGIVRNAADTKSKIASWNRSNIHIVQADLAKYESLKAAVEAVSAITPSLDYLIGNAGQNPSYGAFEYLSKQDPVRLTTEFKDLYNANVIGQIHLINLFMPLVLKGKTKKVIAISTGMADVDLTLNYDIFESAAYSASRAAMTMIVAKLQVEWKKEGVLIMAISPGAVDTGHLAEMTPEQQQGGMIMAGKFKAYAPEWNGFITPEESVREVLKTIENASLEKDAGAFVSHFGNKQWL
ncbi:short-chain dehydrogenase [Setomelanomma holmii]|uniref:Short-chain dehydrogenase n=1 Tax=Setomelanomma holmii TaxID=210430 RepID=A0A9P4HHK2_9PLEO|nr:short-chain dehydrogenase [Setomelanomma holmii]